MKKRRGSVGGGLGEERGAEDVEAREEGWAKKKGLVLEAERKEDSDGSWDRTGGGY